MKPPLNPALAFVVPLAIYLVGTAWISKLSMHGYWLNYAVVTVSSALALWYLMRPQRFFQLVGFNINILPGVFVGVVGIVLWILLSNLHWEDYLSAILPQWLQPAQRVGFSPWDQWDNPAMIGLFLTVRLVGIGLVVPVIEELFWRGFLLRWTIDADWQSVPLGTFTWKSCFIVVLLFTAAHPEWLAAAVYCLLINGLLYWRKQLWQCIVAHSVSNLLLALYIIQTQSWWLW